MTVTERPAFDLSVSYRDGIPVFHMKGRLMDQQQADRLMESLNAELGKGPASVVLDMVDLQYMNSTGLNILISVLTTTRNKGGCDTLIANWRYGRQSAGHTGVRPGSSFGCRWNGRHVR